MYGYNFHLQLYRIANYIYTFVNNCTLCMYVLSWVFENYFKQIQNQQEAGIQDGI